MKTQFWPLCRRFGLNIKIDHCNWSGPYTECFEGDK